MNSHQRRVARRARAKEILRAFGLAMDGVSRGFAFDTRPMSPFDRALASVTDAFYAQVYGPAAS